MKKNNNVFADLTSRSFYVILALNFVRALDVAAGLCAVIAWIITTDHTFGIVLAGTIVLYFLLNLVISIVGVRLFNKTSEKMFDNF